MIFHPKTIAMKKIFGLVLLLLGLVIACASYAQNYDPEGLLAPDGIVDQLGRRPLLLELSGNNPNYKHISTFPDCDLNDVGYFNIWIELGSGFDGDSPLHETRRKVLCQVLSDISAYIPQLTHPNNPAPKVNLVINTVNTEGKVATSGTWFYAPCCAENDGGIIESTLWKTVNTGYNGWTGVVLPLSPINTMHAVIGVNFSLNPSGGDPIDPDGPDQTFYYDLENPNLPSNKYDLYSVILHEMIHTYDFTTLFRPDGLSVMNQYGNYFSRYDSHLQIGGTGLLDLPNGECPFYNPTIVGSIDPYEDCPEYELTQEYFDAINACPECTDFECDNPVIYSGSTTIPTLTTGCAIQGLSMSHLGGCIEDNYLLTSLVDVGWMQRSPHPDEHLILQDLGYKVSNTYGTVPQIVQTSYESSSVGIPMTAVNDGIFQGGYQYVSFPYETLTICISDLEGGILYNDRNATGAKCFEIMHGSGILETISGASGCPAEAILYTPSEPGVHLIRYIPTGPEGEGNIAYIVVYSPNNACLISCSEELIPDPGLESVNEDDCGNLAGYILNCWDDSNQTPELFSSSLEEGGPANTCSEDDYILPLVDACISGEVNVWQGESTEFNQNYHFIRLRGPDPSPNWHEGVQTLLNAPIIVGETYEFSIRAMCCNSSGSDADLGSGGNLLEIAISEFPIPPSIDAPFDPANSEILHSLHSFSVPNNGQWNEINGEFTVEGEEFDEGEFFQYLVLGNSTPGDWNEAFTVLIDDFSLKPADIPPFLCEMEDVSICVGGMIDLTDLLEGCVPTSDGFFFVDGVETTVFDAIPDIGQEPEDVVGSYWVEYFHPALSPGCPLTANITVLDPADGTLNISTNNDSPCPGEPVTLTADFQSDPPSVPDYLWWSGSYWLENETQILGTENPMEFTAYSPTIVGVTATDEFGCLTDYILVTPESLGVSLSPPSGYVCDGDPVIVTVSNGENISISPVDEAPDDVWTEVDTGVYEFLIDGSLGEAFSYTIYGTVDGCDLQQEITITIGEYPVVTVTSESVYVCEGNNATITAEGAEEYLWTITGGTLSSFSGSSVVATATGTEPMIVSVTGTTEGCSTTPEEPVSVPILTYGTIELVADPPFVCGSSSTTITGTLTGGASNAQLGSWEASVGDNPTDTDNEITVYPTETTTYTVSSTGTACIASEDITVEAFESPVIQMDSPTVEICTGDEVTITLSGFDSPEDGTYEWTSPEEFAGQTASSITLDTTDPGSITVTATGTDANGCVDTETEVIEVVECCNLAATAVATNAYCALYNDGAIDLTISGDYDPESLTISWTGPDNFTSDQEDLTDLFFGSYTVIVADSDCSDEITVFVANDNATCCTVTVESNSPYLVCDGGTADVFLSISHDATNPAYTVTWTNLPAGFDPSSETQFGLPIGTYQVNVDADGCSGSETVVVEEMSGNSALNDYESGGQILLSNITENLSFETWLLNFDLVIDENITVIGSHFVFAQGTGMIIEEGVVAQFDECVFSTCDDYWDGIVVKSSSLSGDFGTLRVSDSVIEFALAGVYTQDEEASFNNWDVTNEVIASWIGGAIGIDRTQFNNNFYSVHIDHANEVYDWQEEIEHSFEDCQFRWNDGFYDHFGILNLSNLSMVRYSYTRGYGFLRCTFENSTTQVNNWNDRYTAINSIDSRYDVIGDNTVNDDGLTTDHGDMEFSGFTEAIHAGVTIGAFNHMNIYYNGFEQNLRGIVTDYICWHDIVANHFQLAQPTGIANLDIVDPDFDYEGIVVLTGAFFAITDNTIEKIDGIQGARTAGIRVFNTGSSGDNIYRNNFNNLQYGILFNDDNADEDNEIGVRVACNDFNVCSHDVTSAGTLGTDLADIALDINQRYVQVPADPINPTGEIEEAGNQFSESAWTYNDFFHSGEGNMLTYHSYPGETQDFEFTTNIELDQGFFTANSCPGLEYSVVNIVGEDTELELTDLSEFIDQAHDDKEEVEFLLLALIDGGDTETLVEEIDLAWTDDTWEMRDQLLALSPYVSKTTLYSVADRTDVFPHPIALEIFVANPNVLRDSKFLGYLETKTDPMPDYMLDVLWAARNTETMRTLLELEYANKRAIEIEAINKWIHLMENTSLVDDWEVDEALIQADCLWGNIHVTEHMLHNDMATNHGLFLSALQDEVLEPFDATNRDSFVNWINWLTSNPPHSFENLDEAKRVELRSFAVEGQTFAASRARNILNFYYGEGWTIDPSFDAVEPRSFSYDRRAEEEKWMSVQPNPAVDFLTLQFDLPDYYFKTQQVQIVDINGRLVDQFALNQSNQVTIIDTRSWDSGLYLYTVMLSDESILSRKFEVIR